MKKLSILFVLLYSLNSMAQVNPNKLWKDESLRSFEEILNKDRSVIIKLMRTGDGWKADTLIVENEVMSFYFNDEIKKGCSKILKEGLSKMLNFVMDDKNLDAAEIVIWKEDEYWCVGIFKAA